MPTVPETPLRRIRFQEMEPESSMDVDSGGGETNGGDRVAQCFDLKEDPSFWKDNNVQVVIRIRPLSSSEISLQGQNRCVRQDSYQSITWTGHPESRFTFDQVAGEQVTQEQLFKVAGVPMVDNCVTGYNSCMFAYGQTGSGKTHTMLGDIEGGTHRHSVDTGMTPRVFEYLFSRIQKEREARRDEKLWFICKCSFLEIYNEQILDLLDPSSSNLQIREDARKGIHVENLTEFEVSSARDVIQQLVQGAANRKVASTNMNRASSRSHSVFTCTIESKWESQGVTHHRFARLNLVDLAGSERQKSSGAEGDRLKEATNINKSLSTLGLVIMNLVSISNKKSLHVPYRDSKLTFLLQDSLGGNSKTIIIANISPSNCCALETLSTLKFAQRAKFIRNNAVINEDASGDVIALRMQIQQLKKEVHRLQALVNGGYENQEADNMSFANPESPGSFKWDGGQGSFTPLMPNKRLSQRKEYEAVLVAAIRRDQDKDKALKALIAEKQAAEQLASQRSDEVQALKMRLRFREERIKRLEAVSLGKLSAEAHLLNEKQELLKELEVLRNQADRNREATRFAMENLQLKEELRRLQSFVQGERDMMNEQIAVLQDKLLEALDWKLMHEKDMDMVQRSLDFSSSNEEMEFLRLQAIQNQREVDALRKNLSSCLEAKEKLERRVDDLVLQLEEQMKRTENLNGPIAAENGSHLVASFADGSSDQFELKAMVEAIATASQREAEAHETAITLAKENEELRAKLKVLIEDNNKLIVLCENLADKGANGKNADAMPIQNNGLSEYVEENRELAIKAHDVETSEVENVKHQLCEIHEENEKLMGLYEQAMQERDAKTMNVERLEHQLQEIHEENDKLMGLYEQAMQERDLKTKNVKQLEHQLREMHEENDKLMGLYEQAMQERDVKTKNVEQLEHQLQEMHEENDKLMGLHEQAMQERDVKTENVEQLEHQLHDMQEENDKLMALYGQAMQERDVKTGNVEQLEHQLREMHDENYKLMGFYEQAMQQRDVKTRDLKELELQLQEIHKEHEKLIGLYEQAVQERDELKGILCSTELNIPKVKEEVCCPEKLVQVDEGVACYNKKEAEGHEPKAGCTRLAEHLYLVQTKLGFVQEKFHNTIRVINVFAFLEKQTKELLIVADKLQTVSRTIQSKQEEIASLESSLSTMQGRRNDMNKKLSALWAFYLKIRSIEEGVELQAQARVNATSVLVERKKEALSKILANKQEIDAACLKASKLEAQLKEDYASLKLKYQQAESQKRETEKVLFAIDTLETRDAPSHKILQFGKASELLKSEEERTKLMTEIKQSREKLTLLYKEISSFKQDTEALDAKILDLECEVKSGLILLEESRINLEKIVKDKETLMETMHSGWSEMGKFLVDFQETWFKSELKAAEICVCTEEHQLEVDKLETLKASRCFLVGTCEQLLKNRRWTPTDSHFVEETVKEEIEDVYRMVTEAKSLLTSSIAVL